MSSKKSKTTKTVKNANQFTAKEYGKMKGIDTVMANNFLMVLAGLGYATKMEPRVEGRGRPSNVFEIANKVTVELCSKVHAKNLKAAKKSSQKVEGETESKEKTTADPVLTE